MNTNKRIKNLKYENIILGLSGHISSMDISKYIVNEIPSLLFDNQDVDKKEQLGMLGILSFKNYSDEVGVNWYSSNLDLLYREQNQFKIKIKKLKNEK